MNDDAKTSRREILKYLGAAGALTILGDRTVLTQTKVNKLNVRGGAIDVHHHHQPPGFGNIGRGGPWSPEKTLEQMDKFGISVAILSMTQMGDLRYDGNETGRKNVRTGNEYGAKLMQQYSKKFGLFGGVPLPDIEGTMKEIEYCFDTLKVDGIGIYTNDNKGRWPGDKYFEPMWTELNRRNAIVYMHPLAPNCCSRLEYGPNAAMLEYDFDIARAVASIVVNGVMFRYPKIRFVTVHSGGTVPMLAGRMKDRVPNGSEKYLPEGLYTELRKWYYDVAHATFPWPMAALRAFMPHDHILFGTDYSPEPIESTVNEIPGLGLTDEFMQNMGRRNAE